MREFQERRVWRRILFSRFAFAVLAAILVFLVYSTAKIYLKNRQAEEANNILKKELEDLTAKKANLEASVRKLQTETGIEEEARTKFQIQKPGEKTAVIVEEKNKNDNSPAQTSSSFPLKIWEFFQKIRNSL